MANFRVITLEDSRPRESSFPVILLHAPTRLEKGSFSPDLKCFHLTYSWCGLWVFAFWWVRGRGGESMKGYSGMSGQCTDGRFWDHCPREISLDLMLSLIMTLILSSPAVVANDGNFVPRTRPGFTFLLSIEVDSALCWQMFKNWFSGSGRALMCSICQFLWYKCPTMADLKYQNDITEC